MTDIVTTSINGLSDQQKRTLNYLTDRIRRTQRDVMRDLIRIGRSLQEIRDMLPSNQAFGAYCDREFPELHRNTRTKLMQIHKRFPENINDGNISFSVLAELAAPSTDQRAIDEVNERIAEGEDITVNQVKEIKRKFSGKHPEDVKYDLIEAMASILGNAASYADRYKGTDDEAAEALANFTIKDKNTAERDADRIFNLKNLIDKADSKLQDKLSIKGDFNHDRNLTAFMMLAERYWLGRDFTDKEAAELLFHVATRDKYNANSYISGLLKYREILNQAAPSLAAYIGTTIEQ